MNRAALAAAVLVTLPALARAEPMHAPAERAQDKAELRQDRRELADDWRDVRWLEQLLARFDDARARRARRDLYAVESDVLRTLDRELWEARAEATRSAGEARRDRYGVRDDRRDLRDDRRDLARVSALRSEFGSLRGRMDRRALDRKRGLVAELVRLSRAEVREDRAERREDGRDRREDRRAAR